MLLRLPILEVAGLNAPFAIYEGCWLMKICEQGFRVPVRNLTVAGHDYLETQQDVINSVCGRPDVFQELDFETLRLLQPVSVWQRSPNGYPQVDYATAEALMRLVIVNDAALATDLPAIRQRMMGFIQMTEEDLPWFRLLYSLEILGVIEGIFERQSSAASDAPERSFLINPSALESLRQREPILWKGHLRVIETAQKRDADAQALYRQLHGVP